MRRSVITIAVAAAITVAVLERTTDGQGNAGM